MSEPKTRRKGGGGGKRRAARGRGRGAGVRALALDALVQTERALDAIAEEEAQARSEEEPPPVTIGSPAWGKSAPPASQRIDDMIREHALDARDAGLLAELVYGTIRHRVTLDRIVRAHVVGSRKGRLELSVRVALWLGVYQLVFLDRVPAHAAVSETVAALDRPGRRGFVNAVLRAVTGSCGVRYPGPRRPRGKRRESLVPIHGLRWRQLRKSVFPSFAREAVAALAACHSHPEALVDRWIRRFGLETAEELLRIDNEPPPIFLRANLRRTTREELIEALQKEGVRAEPGELDEAVRVVTPGRIERLAAFEQGLFTVQDETAMSVARRVDPRPGERILDLCAAPGGKATHLAELTDDKAEIVAVDVRPRRLLRLQRAIERLGLERCRTVLAHPVTVEEAGDAGEVEEFDLAGEPGGPDGEGAEGEGLPAPVRVEDIGEGFDRVLVDAPCSNTGVLRRRVEARWRQPSPERLEALVRLQMRLLELGADRLGAGGLLIYSTCSIDDEENGQVVRAVVDRRPELSLLEEWAPVPRIDGGDGGYVARILRS